MTINRRIGAICVGAIVFEVVAFFSAQSFWLHRTAVQVSAPPEEPVVQIGTISTNGWEFTLTNILDFGRPDVKHFEFNARTRTAFVSFAYKDDGISQHDLDTGKLLRTFHMGKGFIPYNYAVSPDGHFLIAERISTEGLSSLDTRIIEVQSGRIIRDLGDIGCWTSWPNAVRFGSDGKSVWLPVTTYQNYNGGAAFMLDGTPLNASKSDFPAPETNNLLEVPFSKSNYTNYGLFYTKPSGITNRITKDSWWGNYAINKDRRLVLVATWHDDIILWDAETMNQIVRQRITNHHNGAGHVAYDEAKDRFLIADPSYQGVRYLRALMITKRPSG